MSTIIVAAVAFVSVLTLVDAWRSSPWAALGLLMFWGVFLVLAGVTN